MFPDNAFVYIQNLVDGMQKPMIREGLSQLAMPVERMSQPWRDNKHLRPWARSGEQIEESNGHRFKH